MRFDVPVIGLPTIEHMKNANATALAVDAGRTLLFDRIKLIELADAAGIAIQAVAPAAAAEPKNTAAGEKKGRGRENKRGRDKAPLLGPREFGGKSRAVSAAYTT